MSTAVACSFLKSFQSTAWGIYICMHVCVCVFFSHPAGHAKHTEYPVPGWKEPAGHNNGPEEMEELQKLRESENMQKEKMEKKRKKHRE